MPIKRAAAAAFTMLTWVSTSSVIAADRGFYLGASGGQSSVDTDIDFDSIVDDVAFPRTSSDLDRKDTGFSVFGGYRFFRYLAVEVEYLDLGQLSYTAVGSIPAVGGPRTVVLGLDIESKGPAGSVLGILPLSDNFELFGRAGFFFADTQISGRLSGAGLSDFDSDSEEVEYAHVGVGAALNLHERWTIRFEFRAFEDVDNEETTLDYTNLSIVYRL